MLKNLLLIITVLLAKDGVVLAQINLVPNQSFEVKDSCPTNVSQVYIATPWFSTLPNGGSSDYFNSCFSSGGVSVGIPDNIAGHQYPQSGNAYVGIEAKSPGSTNVREYIEVMLTDSLVKNKKYSVSFYVSLADYCMYAIDKMGAYFSKDSVDTLTNQYLSFSPQVTNPPGIVLNDTAAWMLVSGTFRAMGGEHFMTIGNFSPDSDLTIDTVPGGLAPYAYYYVDNVLVAEDTSTTGLDDPFAENENTNVYPNPSAGKFSVSGTEKIQAIEVYNVLGELVFRSSLNAPLSTIDLYQNPDGIYFASIRTKGKMITKKLVKQN